MNLELVTDGLAVIGAGTCLYWAIRAIGSALGWIERSEIARQAAESAAAPVPPARPAAAARKPVAAPTFGIPAAHVAAIAAAVAVIAEGHKVVFIEDSNIGHAWASEGRWMHQTSHRTH
ncbi:hypothetical protein EYW49_19995 [Siculibacillus lacustris]|uniref:Uncharacterized protein n=1 Tax=Siculibacillus lacustris TaxID=1549641 RepID=A0A4Q9VGF9_9HYPH|nr:hypothetical protein [Siculibacillus lacustris]TBW33567.1 hypothetical protein EYW49_19995 [Siculibacillus lacustris]